MDKDKLEDSIKEIRNKIVDHKDIYNKNETAVRDQLIEPILLALGWDTKNPNEVLPEQKTQEGKPDYSLIIDGDPYLYIEAKNLSRDIKDKNNIRQLARYAFDKGKDFGILTNGKEWLLFRSYEKNTDVSDRVIWSVDISEDSIEKIIVRLKTISDENIQSLPNLTQKQDILSETWDTIVQSPEILVDAIAPVIKEQQLKEEDITQEEIKEFLEWKLPEEFNKSRPKIIKKNEVKDHKGPKKEDKEPKKIKIKNKTKNLTPNNITKEILLYTANYLFDNGYLTKSDVPIASGYKRYIVNTEPFHKNNEDFTSKEKLNCGLYLETHNSTDRALELAKKLFTKAGLNSDEVELIY